MKKYLYIAALACCTLMGCDKIDDATEIENNGPQATLNTTGKDCIVAINPVGEITTSESPITKGSTPTDDIYLVQVKQKVLNSNGQYEYLNFAMGYFDNLDAMKLYLKQGSQYRIIVAMVKNAKYLLGTRYNPTQASLRSCVVENNVFTGYKDVFDFFFRAYSSVYISGTGGQTINGRYFYNGDIASKAAYDSSSDFYFFERRWSSFDDLNSLNYNCSTLSSARPNNGKYFPVNHYQYVFKNQLDYYGNANSDAQLQSLSAWNSDINNKKVDYPYLLFIENAILNNVNYPSCDGWFYGEAVDYNPVGDYESLDLNFKRVGFGLKYELTGVTDGEVTVKIYNDTRTFVENTTNTANYSSAEQFIAFYNAHDAWLYADNYSENLTVSVVWKRGIGVTQDLGTKTIQVKRNCLNNVKIRLGSDDRDAAMAFSAEAESTMGSSTTDIPVQ